MRENDNRSPEEIESDIERTRADFSSTIEAIQQKLTPREMMDHAVDYALSTKPGAFSASLVTSVRANPIPVALIGIGVAWLMAANRRSSGAAMYAGYQRTTASTYNPDYYSAYDSAEGLDYESRGRSADGLLHRATSKASETAQDLKEKAGEVGQRLSGTASDMTDRVYQAGQSARSRLQETAEEAQARINELSERSRMQYYRTRDRLGQMADEQPLVIGALGIALGAVLGATLPTTRRENELMGGTRDELLGRMKETALEQAETVKQSAQRVAEVAKQEAGRVKEDLSNAATQVKDQAGSTTPSGSVGATPYGSVPGQTGLH